MTRTYHIHHAVGQHITRPMRTCIELVYNRNLRRVKTIRILTLTTDNGSEFLDHEAIEALFLRHGAPKVYYTHAYASWEKGSVENANRLVRRWYPKGTDFSRVSPARIAALESDINSIHRKLLGGHTAQEAYHAAA